MSVSRIRADKAVRAPLLRCALDFNAIIGRIIATRATTEDPMPATSSITPAQDDPGAPQYRGRLAPSPTGLLHLGHARTFWTAQQRAQQAVGRLVLRNEDLDPDRCKPEFVAAMLEDLHWFGFRWNEGPDCGGPFGPYSQSERRPHYLAAFEALLAAGVIYPCVCSRRDVQRAAQAPHVGDEEPVYPGACRPGADGRFRVGGPELFVPKISPARQSSSARPRVNWRFRVPDDEPISFSDSGQGLRSFVAGRDFGDFVVWRHDDVPSYQLAVTVDDALMHITEVVRGADLLVSTARQLLLYRALGWAPPSFHHCPLLTDEAGSRLAKRHDAFSLRGLRQRGETPAMIRSRPEFAS
jgi:glutamyl-tRNA synthetase